MQPDNFDNPDTLIIGYAEDGLMWVTESPEVTNASAAEEILADWSGVWRAVADVHVYPELGHGGQPLGGGDEAWFEGDADKPWGRKAWRLVDVTQQEIVVLGDEKQNPHYDPQVEG
jgi:hypothetical protein